MSTKIDIQGPLLLRVMDEDNVQVLLERYVSPRETLYIDTEPEAKSNVVTMVMGDEVKLRTMGG